MDSAWRLFIAIELPPQVQAVLAAARVRLDRHTLAVRWVDPASAHLTLKFLGATPPDRVERIVAATKEAARLHHFFTLSTAGLGVFPSSKAPRVVWLGLSGSLAELRDLQADIERLVAPLGYPAERRPFSPHLTLGRTAKDASPTELAAIGATINASTAEAAATWRVSTVSLMRSELGAGGARYTALARLDLGGGQGSGVRGRQT